MSRRTEIRVAGFGGQGVILAGYILGRAATIYEGKYATLTQSYGPESRGSACSAQLIVSDSEIFYPELIEPDVILLMSQEAQTRFSGQIKKQGLILYDSTLVVPADSKVRQAGIPASELAGQLGKKIVANVVMLGFLAGQTGLVSLDALRKTITDVVAKQHLELNLKALQTGYSHKETTQAVSST
jgi:2-oxoglutarate ferredoxin oxidoreductase subunit gamma